MKRKTSEEIDITDKMFDGVFAYGRYLEMSKADIKIF